MYYCEDCNTRLTDDIKFSDKLCYPCKEIIDKKEYTEYLIEIGSLFKCENCGNIWDGNAQCNCWTFEDIIDYEEEYTRCNSPVSVTELN